MTFHKEATKTTPGIQMDMDQGKIVLIGRSSPENSVQFYSPVMDNLRGEHNLTRLEIDFKLEYFNTSSSKSIYDIVKELKNIQTRGVDIQINWYYEPMDDDMLEAGEDYSDLVDISFNFIEEEDFVEN